MYIALFPGAVVLWPPQMAHYDRWSLWSLLLTGEAGVEAKTAGSASWHSLYEALQVIVYIWLPLGFDFEKQLKNP